MHSNMTLEIRGARPVLMSAVKPSVIWQVGRGRHLGLGRLLRIRSHQMGQEKDAEKVRNALLRCTVT
jgi:hypothetical protein